MPIRLKTMKIDRKVTLLSLTALLVLLIAGILVIQRIQTNPASPAGTAPTLTEAGTKAVPAQTKPEGLAATTATPAPSLTAQPGLINDSQPGITVWIDEVRRPAVQAYIDAHPDTAGLINIVIADRGNLPGKVLQFNKEGAGWPDVVFAEPNLVLQVADEAHDFPLDLYGLVSDEIINNFVPGALDACTIDGKILCLRYDLAQMVLYYNKPLMDEFGYAIPTTWEEYQALSDRVAAEHPGYIMGSFGDAWGFRTYFTPSGCPFGEVIDAGTIRIDLSHPGCVRAADMVEHMLENGTLLAESAFSPAFIQAANDNKLLMMVAAAWFGEYMFGGKADSLYYKTAEGQLGVALPLKWEGEREPITDAMGGGAWTVSNHTQSPELAVDLIVWMTTSIEALKTGPDYPAYEPICAEWGEFTAQNPLYAFDPFPVWDQAASMISPQNNEPRYDSYAVLDKAVRQVTGKQKKFSDILPEMQKELEKLAEGAGYQVIP